MSTRRRVQRRNEEDFAREIEAHIEASRKESELEDQELGAAH